MMYLKMINKRAKDSFKYEWSIIHMQIWLEHWFDTAYEIKAEFLAENLNETAEFFQNHINEQLKFCEKELVGTKYDRSADQKG